MTRKLKLAIVSTMAEFPWGGSEELWGATAELALMEGHDVMALIPAWDPRADKVQGLMSKGLKLAEWNELHSSTELNQHHSRPIWHPYQALLDFSPDIVMISHGGFMDCVNGHILLIQMLIEKNIPYVLMIQANTDLYFPNESQRQILKIYYARAVKVFFAARQNLEIARRQLALPLENGGVFYSPIKLDVNDAISWPNSSTALMASVARLDPLSKGQDILLEVLSYDRWRDRDWKLKLFGAGAHENYYRELVSYYHLEDKVEITGKNEDMRKIWSEHQILVLPSRIEGTPIVLFGAMMCGRAAVVTDVGGNADWIKDEETGFVAKAATPDLFSEALEKSWINKQRWQEMGKAAREYFVKQHEVDTETKFFKILKELALGIENNNSNETKFNNDAPRISVVITCCNQANNLADAVQSVINQTYKDYEIIIVDNGSSDTSKQIAANLITKYSQTNISLINQEYLGELAASRNKGIEKARGEFIICLDAQDLLSPTMLENSISILDKDKTVSIVYTDARLIKEGAENSYVESGEFDLTRVALEDKIFYCALYRKEVWKKVGGYKLDAVGSESWEFWISCADYGLKAVKIPKDLFIIRMVEDIDFNNIFKKEESIQAKVVLSHPNLYDDATVTWAKNINALLRLENPDNSKAVQEIDFGSRCPIDGSQGEVIFQRDSEELIAAYENYLGAALPEWVKVRYFNGTVFEYQSQQSGLRWYSPGIVGDSDYYEALGQIYPWYYRDESWDKDIICEILKSISCPAFVEFGCGNGAFLKQAKENGIKGWGVDITKQAVKTCRERGLEAYEFDDLPSSLPHSDTLCLLQTVEHLPNPVEYLQNVINKIKCQTIILSAPSHEALLGYTRDPLSWPPHHFSAWSEQAFSSLAKVLGFKLAFSVSEPLTYERLEGMLKMEGTRKLRNLPSFPEGGAGVAYIQQMQEKGEKWSLYSHSIVAVLQK